MSFTDDDLTILKNAISEFKREDSLISKEQLCQLWLHYGENVLMSLEAAEKAWAEARFMEGYDGIKEYSARKAWHKLRGK